jgi:putative hydrolase of the HAD superfamily
VNNSFHTALFDFDGTLVFHEPDSFEVIRAYCNEIGQPLSAEAERQGRRMRHQYFVDPEIVARLRSLSRDQFWSHFYMHLLEAMDVEGDLEGHAAEMMDRAADLSFTYTCPEAGCQTLTELRDRGYELGLITNRDSVEGFHKVLDETDLWPYFDLILASGEVGIRKPEPGIFCAALERLGSRPDQAFYVGDNYWADVVGAERAGLTPVLLDPDRLFPEAECLVLDSIDQILAWLP